MSLPRGFLHGSRQRLPLPRARQPGSRQRLFSKKIKNLCRESTSRALGKDDVNIDVPWRRRGFCRRYLWPSAKSLPRVCHLALGKDFFAESSFAESHVADSRQRLCRKLLGLCRGLPALGKEGGSSSRSIQLFMGPSGVEHDSCPQSLTGWLYMLLGGAKQLDSPPCYGVQNKQASRELDYRECARLASITKYCGKSIGRVLS